MSHFYYLCLLRPISFVSDITMRKGFIILLLLSWLAACSCGKPASCGAPALHPVPSITEVSPLSGGKATTVVIKGADFGTDARRVTVCFNRKKATVASVSDSLLTAVVPADAGSGMIEITVSGKSATGPQFVYTADWQTDDEYRSGPRPAAAKAISVLTYSLRWYAAQAPKHFPRLL